MTALANALRSTSRTGARTPLRMIASATPVGTAGLVVHRRVIPHITIPKSSEGRSSRTTRHWTARRMIRVTTAARRPSAPRCPPIRAGRSPSSPAEPTSPRRFGDRTYRLERLPRIDGVPRTSRSQRTPGTDAHHLGRSASLVGSVAGRRCRCRRRRARDSLHLCLRAVAWKSSRPADMIRSRCVGRGSECARSMDMTLTNES